MRFLVNENVTGTGIVLTDDRIRMRPLPAVPAAPGDA